MFRIFQLKNLSLYCLNKERSVSLYQKGWQFSSHSITARNVKDLLPENTYLITSIATAAKQPSSKPQGFDERSSYLGIAYF